MQISPLKKITIVLLLIAAAIALVVYGINFRKQQWENTLSIHYQGDVYHGYGWGHIGRKLNLFAVYDMFSKGQISGYPNELDYTPLRLTVVTYWARWAYKNFPNTPTWRNDYELTWPMLYLNATAELLSSIIVFLLIRLWIIRMDDAKRSPLEPPRAFRGVARGFVGALFFWFNPAVVWDGHCFPQWDVWNAPFYLGGVLLACLDWWFAAGICIVIGAFFKGQILLVSPIFIIWPLVQLRFIAILRFIIGFAFGGTMLALPWFNTGTPTITWYALFIAAMGLVSPIALRWRIHWIAMLTISLCAALLAWPWTSTAPAWIRLTPIALIAGIACCRFLVPHLLPYAYALSVASAIALMIPLFNASTAWYTQGFEFGTKKLMWMATDDTYSLPHIMEIYYRWSSNPNVGVRVFWSDSTVPFRNLMLMVYGACLLLCGIGAAMHSKRNDSRFLVAVVTPWLCWFVLLTQLNNRYMIWAAGFSSLLVGVSLGMTLLGMIVSFIGWAGIAQILTWSGRDSDLARIVNPLTPHMLWPLMFIAMIYLYMSVAPGSSRRIKRAAAPLP